MPSARLTAFLFAGLIGLVIAFQLALAAGAPWGAYAMGGAFPGVYPPPMRVGALIQAVLLATIAVVVLSRAGAGVRGWRPLGLAWAITGLLALGVVLNLITPSAGERTVWAPVAAVLFLASLRVSLAR